MLGNHQLPQNNAPGGLLRNNSPGVQRPPPLGMHGGNTNAQMNSGKLQGLPKLPPGRKFLDGGGEGGGGELWFNQFLAFSLKHLV